MVDQAERLREIIKSNRIAPSPARVIAVTSGKGGVGKTTFSVNLGIALSRLGKRVTLVDADLGLANVDVLLGLIPQYNLGHVISGQKKIADTIINGPAGLKIVASGSGVYNLANLSERALEQCMQYLNEIEDFTDILLIDTGAGISRNVLKFVLAAGEVVIVTTPEPTAITDAYGIIKVVVSANQNIPLWVVVNMIHNEAEGIQTMEKLAKVSQRFLGTELKKIGFIPSDPLVSKAVKEQQPLIIKYPQSAAAQSIKQIAKNLINGTPVAPTGTQSFFQRLSGRFR